MLCLGTANADQRAVGQVGIGQGRHGRLHGTDDCFRQVDWPVSLECHIGAFPTVGKVLNLSTPVWFFAAGPRISR